MSANSSFGSSFFSVIGARNLFIGSLSPPSPVGGPGNNVSNCDCVMPRISVSFFIPALISFSPISLSLFDKPYTLSSGFCKRSNT